MQVTCKLGAEPDCLAPQYQKAIFKRSFELAADLPAILKFLHVRHRSASRCRVGNIRTARDRRWLFGRNSMLQIDPVA
jgi:hypothetical protein